MILCITEGLRCIGAFILRPMVADGVSFVLYTSTVVPNSVRVFFNQKVDVTDRDLS